MRVHRTIVLPMLIGAAVARRMRQQQLLQLDNPELLGLGQLQSTRASSSVSGSSNTQAQLGFEGIPIQTGADIAPASTTQTGTVNGIQCGSKEQLAYHIHAHLTVFDNGQARSLPGGIGIPGSQAEQSQRGSGRSGRPVHLLAAHPRPRWRHPCRVSDPAHLHAGRLLRRVAPAAERQPGGRRQGQGQRNRRRQAVDQEHPRDPARPPPVIQLNVGSPVPFETVNWSGTGL